MRFMMTVIALAVVVHTSPTEAADQAADRAAITAAVESYTGAFNARDAEKLAAHWGPEAVYLNPLTGEQSEGREAITKAFVAILDALGDHKLSVEVDSIQFVSPGVAVENGQATLVSSDEGAQSSTYTAIHVKRDGKWLLDRVTEEDVPVVLSHHEQLKELEWLIGRWVDADDAGRIDTTCSWTRNRNFMTRSFTVSLGDRIDLTGMQIIGWDPANKRIRSWTFDSDGGFAQGVWTQKGNRWSIVTSGTLPEGGKASSVNVITRIDDNQFKWKSLSRVSDGQLLPNIDEVVVVRAASDE